MNVDFNTYISNHLLIAIRKARVYELISTLMKPIRDKHQTLITWRAKARLYAAATCQVCWLQKLLREEVGDNSISIVESTGQPTDFIVYTQSLEIDRIKALLNRFKQYGRSYSVVNTAMVSAARWLDPVCEQMSIAYTARWIDPACDQVSVELRFVESTYPDGVYTLTFETDGSLLSYPSTAIFYIQYGGSVSVQRISGADFSNLWLGDEIIGIPRRRRVYFRVGDQIPGNPERACVYRFTSGTETFDLTFKQIFGDN